MLVLGLSTGVMYAVQFEHPDDFRAAHPSAAAAYVVDHDLAGVDAARRFMDLVTELATPTA